MFARAALLVPYSVVAIAAQQSAPAFHSSVDLFTMRQQRLQLLLPDHLGWTRSRAVQPRLQLRDE